MKQLPSRTELLALHLLRDSRGIYGLELVRQSRGTIKVGSVYVLLNRLRAKGLITVRGARNGGHNGLPRPLYQLTADGKRMLEAWAIITNRKDEHYAPNKSYRHTNGGGRNGLRPETA